MKKLTIGIPTWNRATEIRDALDSVVFQLQEDEKLKNEVEIFVSINASTDNTEDVIKKYQDKFKDIEIRYFVQPVNVGFDRNVDNLFKHAKGEFVWLLSDDDAIEDGAISKVIEIINQNKDNNLGVIFVNYSSYDNSLNKIIGESDPWFLNYQKSQIFFSYEELFTKTNDLGTQMISSNIVNRNAWNNLDLSNYYDSDIIHVFAFLLLHLKKFTTFVEYSKIVKYRTENNEGRWTKIKENPFNLNYSAFVVNNKIISKMNSNIYRFFYKTEFKQLLKGIAYYKSQNYLLDNLSISKSIVAVNGYRLRTFLLIIALYVPNFLYKLIYKLKK